MKCNSHQNTRSIFNWQEEKILSSRGFCRSSEPQSENEGEKLNKYLRLDRERRKLCNMNMIPIVAGAPEPGIETGKLDVRGIIKTIQVTARLNRLYT